MPIFAYIVAYIGREAYDGVTMIVAPNDVDGEVVLNRTVGKNQADVSSTVSGIDSGTYEVNYRKGAKKEKNYGGKENAFQLQQTIQTSD